VSSGTLNSTIPYHEMINFGGQEVKGDVRPEYVTKIIFYEMSHELSYEFNRTWQFYCDAGVAPLSWRGPALERRTTCLQRSVKQNHTTTRGVTDCLFSLQLLFNLIVDRYC